jgi:hypothetical protein
MPLIISENNYGIRLMKHGHLNLILKKVCLEVSVEKRLQTLGKYHFN